MSSVTLPVRLARLFFRNRQLLILAISIILIGGMSALGSLPRLEDPRITNRNITIITPVPGASAERVETLVTEPLERGMQEISGIKDIESTSTAGVSLVSIELGAEITEGKNKEIFSEVRDKVAEVSTAFPVDAQASLIDDKRDPVAFTLITAVRWESSSEINLNVMNRAAEELANRLRTVGGTELVRIYGAPTEEILVTTDAAELAALGMSVSEVTAQLRLADAKKPAGTFRGNQSNINVEVAGELDSIARIENLTLRSGLNGDGIKLADVADVTRHWREPERELGFVDGARVVYVATRMGSARRVDQWAPEANAVVAAYQAELGEGVVLDNIFEQERYTTGLLNSLTSNLVAGAGVVIGVIFVMMGWRLALVVGSVLPLVTAMVLFSLQLSGNTIHQMSIFGMIIAIGLLIDNAIVVADEIMQHRSRGATAQQAVQRAIGHLFVPLLASTLTTVLAFAPILLLPGSAGDFVGSIGSTVITAVICSFFVSITIIAALAGLFAQPVSSTSTSHWWTVGVRPQKLAATYRRLLGSALRNPIAAILIAVFWPLCGFIAATELGNQFFPPVDRDMFQIQVTLPSDSSIENTRREVEAIEERIREFEATDHVYWLVGGSFPTVYYNLIMNKDDSAYYANAIVTASSDASAKAMIAPLQKALDAEFSNAQIVIRQFGQGPPVTVDVEYRLYGPSIETLQDIGETIRLALQSDPDVITTRVSMPRGEPKLWFDADEEEVKRAGLNLVDVANQLQAGLEGSIGGTVLENLEQLPVRVRYSSAVRGDIESISSMQVVAPRTAGSGTPSWVSLHSLGEMKLEPVLGGITRFNAQRTNRVQAYTQNESLPLDVTARVLEKLDREGFVLPAGYRLELGGAAEQEGESTGDLAAFIPLLITLSAATLVLLFRSGTLALLLGTVAVLSIGLGLFATWTMGFPISFNSFLGILGLIGLAFNNSIVVLAAIRADELARAGNREAIVEAIMGSTRHILSTTLTTIGGFLPLLIFVGGDFWPSLSIVLVGGIGGSMILALLMVPAVYSMLPDGWRGPESVSNDGDVAIEGAMS